jgi:hypothetical protein
MVQPVNSSVSLDLARRPRNGRGRWSVSAEHNNSRVLPKTVSGRITLAATSVMRLSVTPAEVAQARVFEGLLQAESAELHDLARRMAGGVDQQLDKGSAAPSWELMQIRTRIDEVQRLLQALRGRFPHPPSDPGR